MYTTRRVDHDHNEPPNEGHLLSYRAGMTLEATLNVETQTPLRQITFPAWPPIKRGDRIRVHIYRGEESELRDIATGDKYLAALGKSHEHVFVKRDYRPAEQAIKIELLDARGNVDATYIDDNLLKLYSNKI